MLVLLLLMMPFNQQQFDNYIEQDRIVLIRSGEVPELENVFVKMVLRRFDVVQMIKKDSDCYISIHHKKAKAKIWKYE
jgi:hypothetical protein